MFSIPSLGKIIVLVAIVAVVWYGFRWFSQLDHARKRAERQQPAARKTADAGTARTGVEETVRCPVCDAFVAARGATSCGRPDCPY